MYMLMFTELSVLVMCIQLTLLQVSQLHILKDVNHNVATLASNIILAMLFLQVYI